jgi:hypothetical protein
MEDIIGIEAEDIEDYTAKDRNAKNTIEVIVETKPERNTMFIIKKNINL